MSNPVPIFVGITRSFWFGIMPALFVALDTVIALAQADVAGPVSEMLALVFGCRPDTAATILRGAGALAALIVAQQRAGSSRPYTMRANAETLK